MTNPTTPSERELFSVAMTDAGYDPPELGAGGGFLFQRDEDRFVGWTLARATAKQEPLTDEQIRKATVPPWLMTRTAFAYGIRFAEQHHGIEVKK